MEYICLKYTKRWVRLIIRTDKGFLGNLSPMQFRYCKLSTFIKVLLLLKVSEANILIYQIEWVTFGCVDYSECQPRCKMKRVIEIWIQLIILLPLLISTFYDLKAFKWPKGTQSAMVNGRSSNWSHRNMNYFSHHLSKYVQPCFFKELKVILILIHYIYCTWRHFTISLNLQSY